ncbi:MAG: membrane or secreted protein [Haliscomenobacter sp.]|nr:membrane or secreted protein [Haliscomenobacter sp.]
MRTRHFSRILGFGVLFLLFLSARPLSGQSRVKVDGEGVMVWEENGAEIHGFGVNYTLPFAFAYRNAKRLGLKPEQEIDRDLYHFSRLGFDLFRVHVWDTEISDTVGNLLSNEQLKLFDYMLFKMKAQGMRMVLTPIAFWGNGWPEPDEDTPGFSYKFGKDACLTNPEAIAAQERYLAQFLNHVNPYTKIAYKDDPAILAFEVSNEPHHREAPEQVTAFINRMIAAMRATGCQKPVFYNISHSVHLADAYFKSDMQGGTFQWYPTGLGAQRELRGNFLPNVDRYAIPFAGDPGFGRMAKYVYEFDAADVNRSYIYPAMARSFRQAGIQFATHFAYDPLYSAYANPEYNTHYMNLAYTPGKALALMISGEVFRRVPRYADLGAYPDNARFGPFRVDYAQDLAELVADTVFYYTNSTPTPHPGPEALKRIAGVGSSSVVRYDGTGAYFLDQLQPGIWRLEVMPDALPFHNPFGRNSLDQEVTKINYRTWSMSVDLPDLGGAFKVTPMNQGNTHTAVVEGNTFAVRPGVYLLARNGIQPAQKPGDRFRYHTLGAFAAPEGSLRETYVIHEPPAELTADLPLPWKRLLLPGRRPNPFTSTRMAHNTASTAFR